MRNFYYIYWADVIQRIAIDYHNGERDSLEAKPSLYKERVQAGNN